MDVIDLSHTITGSMPVYPGTEAPDIRDATSILRDGFAEKLLRFYSHTGTHIDAPAHMLSGANTLDSLSIENFMGPACVIDVSPAKRGRIEVSDIQAAVTAQTIEACDFVLLRSGWSAFWGHESYFADFPLLSEEAALWLSAFPLKGIGIDMLSVDPVGSADFPIHKILFRKGMLIVENLDNLARLDASGFSFSCLPLKFGDADGSPIRACAFRA
ncbi:MAG TPA: cyclase family protein [Rectinemataceae bacterium]|nr:cyclase family protein [Rectinemataceae bacterium]